MAYPTTTVPGIAYLDGTYYVMTADGIIHGSDIENPTSWPALNAIAAQSETDGGVAIAKHVNYVVAFGNWSIEFFYNAGNAVGSPLLRIDSSIQLVGCAHGFSIGQTQNTLFFMGVTKQRGRSIYILEGTNVAIVSTPYVDRILSADDLADVFAFCLRIDGHIYYVLTLGSSDITLFYDTTTKQWGEWTSLTVGTALTTVSVTAVSGKSVLLTKTAHGLSVGTIVQITGSIYSELNINAIVEAVPTANTFSISLIDTGNIAAISSTVTVTPYTEGRFIGRFHSYILGKDFLLDSSANLYEMSADIATDNGIPINAFARLEQLDGGSPVEKQQGRLDFMLNSFPGGSMYERHTDNDHISYSKHRRVKILPSRTRLWRLGSFNKRNFELSHIDPVALQIQSIDVDLET